MYKCNRHIMRRILMLSFLFSNSLGLVYGGKRFSLVQEKKTHKRGLTNRTKRVIDDEYYTRYEDIEREMNYYSKHFDGKIVYCNCDNPRKSNFCKYFKDNFENLKLNKLIATCYSESGRGRVFTKTKLGKYGKISEESGYLNGNGSFDSEECLQYLKECDIVVSNPPFSLLRDYYKILKDAEKKFLFVGPEFASCYEIFVKDECEGNLIPGVHHLSTFKGLRGENKHCGCIWYTNLDHVSQEDLLQKQKGKSEERLTLYGNTISEEDLKKYSNNDEAFVAVDNVKEIPINWLGDISLPSSYIGKSYNDVFYIVGTTGKSKYKNVLLDKNSKPKFKRLLIRRKFNANDRAIKKFITKNKNNNRKSTLKVLEAKRTRS